ncbi:unnamed protein product [Lampetra planeri]
MHRHAKWRTAIERAREQSERSASRTATSRSGAVALTLPGCQGPCPRTPPSSPATRRPPARLGACAKPANRPRGPRVNGSARRHFPRPGLREVAGSALGRNMHGREAGAALSAAQNTDARGIDVAAIDGVRFGAALTCIRRHRRRRHRRGHTAGSKRRDGAVEDDLWRPSRCSALRRRLRNRDVSATLIVDGGDGGGSFCAGLAVDFQSRRRPPASTADGATRISGGDLAETLFVSDNAPARPRHERNRRSRTSHDDVKLLSSRDAAPMARFSITLRHTTGRTAARRRGERRHRGEGRIAGGGSGTYKRGGCERGGVNVFTAAAIAAEALNHGASPSSDRPDFSCRHRRRRHQTAETDGAARSRRVYNDTHPGQGGSRAVLRGGGGGDDDVTANRPPRRSLFRQQQQQQRQGSTQPPRGSARGGGVGGSRVRYRERHCPSRSSSRCGVANKVGGGSSSSSTRPATVSPPHAERPHRTASYATAPRSISLRVFRQQRD